MPRILLPCIALVALCGSLLSAYLARPVPEVLDELIVEPPIQSFGDLRQGDTVTTSFRLFNRCSVPIHIDHRRLAWMSPGTWPRGVGRVPA